MAKHVHSVKKIIANNKKILPSPSYLLGHAMYRVIISNIFSNILYDQTLLHLVIAA